MKMLPRECWRLRLITRGPYAKTHIVASIWEHPPGYLHHERIALSELPNDLIAFDDLKRFGIDLDNLAAVVG